MPYEIKKYPESLLRVLTEEETLELTSRWLSVFCYHPKKVRDEVYLDQYFWHTFSYEKYPALDGEEALSEYRNESVIEYFNLPNNGELAFITKDRIEKCDVMDFYVFPKNMAWTMAFTHEDLGPYFAKHGDFIKLNRKNVDAFIAQEKFR